MRTISFRILLTLCALLCVALAGCHKAKPHSVTLTWRSPPVTPGVQIVGYNVYRTTAPSRQFVRIASRVPGPPYEDRLVLSGRTYFYVVTSVDQGGRESRFSDEARAAIP
jgi:fibronectin type 3 domain-containing protein